MVGYPNDSHASRRLLPCRMGFLLYFRPNLQKDFILGTVVMDGVIVGP